MPQGLARYQQTRKSHFVTFTCFHRHRNLDHPALRDLVVAAIEQARKHFGFYVYGFAVMREHVHLLMSEPERGLVANAIQSLKIASAKRAKSLRFEHTDHPFWQKRYYDRNIRDHKEFVKQLRYTHRNPVSAGYVNHPEDWRWSSFRHYLIGEHCGVEIESEWTARERERRGVTPQLEDV